MKHQLIQEIKQNKEMERDVQRRLEERKRNLEVEETKLERRQNSYTVSLGWDKVAYSLLVRSKRNCWLMWKFEGGLSRLVLKLCSL
jgi:hypothetical protein